MLIYPIELSGAPGSPSELRNQKRRDLITRLVSVGLNVRVAESRGHDAVLLQINANGEVHRVCPVYGLCMASVWPVHAVCVPHACP